MNPQTVDEPVDEVQALSPRRVQLRRTKGWTKPASAVVVARPSRWGNPMRKPGDPQSAAEWFGVGLDLRRRGELPDGHKLLRYPTDDEIRAELRGLDLACWCNLTSLCHADVLLELANS